jgi:hypothetical protein
MNSANQTPTFWGEDGEVTYAKKPVEQPKQPTRNRTPMKDPNSIEAGKSMSADEKESRRNQVCEFFLRAAERGMTDCEMYACFRSEIINHETTESTLRWRREELEEVGTIIVTGQLRKTTSGRNATIRVHRFFKDEMEQQHGDR